MKKPSFLATLPFPHPELLAPYKHLHPSYHHVAFISHLIKLDSSTSYTSFSGPFFILHLRFTFVDICGCSACCSRPAADVQPLCIPHVFGYQLMSDPLKMSAACLPSVLVENAELCSQQGRRLNNRSAAQPRWGGAAITGRLIGATAFQLR